MLCWVIQTLPIYEHILYSRHHFGGHIKIWKIQSSLKILRVYQAVIAVDSYVGLCQMSWHVLCPLLVCKFLADRVCVLFFLGPPGSSAKHGDPLQNLTDGRAPPAPHCGPSPQPSASLSNLSSCYTPAPFLIQSSPPHN